MKRLMKNGIKGLLALACMLALSACMTPKPTRENLDTTLSDYQKLIRWEQSASSVLFVPENLKQEYTDKLSGYDKVRIVEFNLKKVDMAQDQKSAKVSVEYVYHQATGISIKVLRDVQSWVFSAETQPTGWQLTSMPPSFP